MLRFTYNPGWPTIVGLLALITVVIAASYFFARGRASRAWKFLFAALRWTALAALLICLFDPQWIENLRRDRKARFGVILDASRSMAAADLPGGRHEAGRQWIQQHLDSVVPANVEVKTFSFTDRLVSTVDGAALSPTGAVSALARSLTDLLAVRGDDPWAGVLFASDGIENSGDDPVGVAREFRRRGIPIHTLTSGSTNELRDVAVESLQVRRAAQDNAPTRITVSLRSTGFEKSTVPIQIRRGGDVLVSKAVALTGKPQVVDIEFTPRERGFQTYELIVPPQESEWIESNNRRRFGVEVVNQVLRVLYMEGTPQTRASPIPEWKYLKDALQSDTNIQVTTLYRQFGANGRFLNTIDSDPETGERIYPVEHPAKGFPKTLPALLEYDVVIHSDIRKESFSNDQLQNMARMVEQFGGGFVMIGGNSAFGKGGYHKTVLDRIIPVAMEQANDADARPIRARIPVSAIQHPLMNIGLDRADTISIWTKKFPWFYGCNLVDRAKPGATVLAEDPDAPNEYGPAVLIAVQEIGRGRSMAFTPDTTRSWGRDFETLWGEPINPNAAFDEFNSDSRYYRKFWVNAVRWLAAGKLGKTNENVILELSSGYAFPGDRIRASVRVKDAAGLPSITAEVGIFLGRGAESNRVATARYDAALRAHVAEFNPPSTADWIVTAVAHQRGVRIGDDRQLLICEDVDREGRELRARPDVMAEIARQSGGNAFQASVAPGSGLTSLFANLPPPIVEQKRRPAWDKPWWLGLVLAMLGAEWGLRRWRGLA